MKTREQQIMEVAARSFALQLRAGWIDQEEKERRERQLKREIGGPPERLGRIILGDRYDA